MGFLLWCVLVAAVLAAQFEFDISNIAPLDSLDGGARDYARLLGESLLWGPYRSGNYLSIKPRLANSFSGGLMWFNADKLSGVQSARHVYEQNHNMKKASWVQFDPRVGGTQVISDLDCHVDITIDFVKSEDGRNWAVTVDSVPHAGFEHLVTSFVWYSGLAGEVHDAIVNDVAATGFLKLDNVPNPNGYSETLKLSGFSEDLGLFELLVNDEYVTLAGRNVHPKVQTLVSPDLDPSLTHHVSLRVPDASMWRAHEIFLTLLQDCVQDLVDKFQDRMSQVASFLGLLVRDLHGYKGNLHFIQKSYQGPSQFSVIYNQAESLPQQRLSFETLGDKIAEMKAKVLQKFHAVFPLDFESPSDKDFAQQLLSGLLGGLSHLHGDQLVDRQTSFDDEDMPVNINGEVHLPKLSGRPEGPHELFTLVPSRPFFPRGFLWDEGFHLLPLIDYDSDLVLEILKSWFALIDEDGWIAREVILGEEGRSRVPPEFVVQSNAVFNPPTLMLAFSRLLESSHLVKPLSEELTHENLGHAIMGDKDLLHNFTSEIYPQLQAHYERMRTTQRGEANQFGRSSLEIYRWRGRTSTHSLASGLDDYPRVLPMDIAELNVDLICWVGVMTRSVKSVAGILGKTADVEYYTDIERQIAANIEEFHWSEKEKAYCDASVDDDDEHMHACFKGYISLFPFLTRFIPSDGVDKIEHIVDMLADPEELWSDYGIRSLSKSDPYYRTAENYWRSPIWININYLVLESLQYYYAESSAHLSEALKQKMNTTFSNLRANLITNVKLEWERTGFVWEQYDDVTGQAKGAKNFMGWTSLILLIMKMPPALQS